MNNQRYKYPDPPPDELWRRAAEIRAERKGRQKELEQARNGGVVPYTIPRVKVLISEPWHE